jgi:hypothetical protein
MKTITLSEEAYERLKSWKTDSSESFSKVVLKAVPKRGTAADMAEAFDQLPKLSGHQAEAVAAEERWANDWQNCPAPLIPSTLSPQPSTTLKSLPPSPPTRGE